MEAHSTIDVSCIVGTFTKISNIQMKMDQVCLHRNKNQRNKHNSTFSNITTTQHLPQKYGYDTLYLVSSRAKRNQRMAPDHGLQIDIRDFF